MIHQLATSSIPWIGANPNPSPGPFQSALGGHLAMLMALVWAGGFIYAASRLLIGVTRLANAMRQDVADPGVATRREVGFAAMASVGLSVIALVWGVMVG